MKSKHHAMQIGLHSVRNIFGDQNQLSLFSDHSSFFCNEYGIKLQGTIDRFGVDLSDTQSKIMEGILRGFSETAYKGNIEPIGKDKVAAERYSGKLPPSFNNIKELPRLRVTQSKLLEMSGISKNSIASWARGVEAIKEIATTQFCFYYDRLVYDENGIPLKDHSGRWKKEEVIAVDSLFTIKEIREEVTGNLKYYEIEPSPIFLDQRESYFMLIPFGWREEVKALVGNKKASSYTFRLLLFLRFQYELFRRSPKKFKNPFQIRSSPEEIAIAIKMPESVYLRKKKRALEILEDAYSVAKRLGYLTDYTLTECQHVLTLNDSKYSHFNNLEDPTNLSLGIASGNPQQDQRIRLLFNLFHEMKRSIDPHHAIPQDSAMQTQLDDFKEVLEQRPFEDVEKLIRWALNAKFWCSQISTPKKLKENFGRAWSEFVLSKKLTQEEVESINKTFSKEKLSKYENTSFNGINISVLNKYVEIVGGGAQQPVCIPYTDKNFRESLFDALKRYKIPINL